MSFKYADDLATVWCEYCEMELRHSNFKRAVELLKQVTAEPARPRRLSPEEERQQPVQARSHRCCLLLLTGSWYRAN